jgi:hypothetical protein
LPGVTHARLCAGVWARLCALACARWRWPPWFCTLRGPPCWYGRASGDHGSECGRDAPPPPRRHAPCFPVRARLGVCTSGCVRVWVCAPLGVFTSGCAHSALLALGVRAHGGGCRAPPPTLPVGPVGEPTKVRQRGGRPGVRRGPGACRALEVLLRRAAARRPRLSGCSGPAPAHARRGVFPLCDACILFGTRSGPDSMLRAFFVQRGAPPPPSPLTPRPSCAHASPVHSVEVSAFVVL